MADLPPHEALPFPPITAQHILNCSYHNWHPKFRSRTPKARLIPLTPAFINYLKSDGIVLPPESHQARSTSHDADNDSGYSDDDEDSDTEDPSEAWSEIHAQIQETIKELGGKVLPKLNWSAPKDATWISTTNDMDCQSANDVYLLLKSSDFITHDLEQAFDGCVDGEGIDIPYHLVLRKSFQLNPSVEFRCFVRNGKLIAISQREMNHFEFLFGMRNQLRRVIEENIPDFADPNFVFDVYIPPPHEKVWLIDINPWAPRTDPLLFSWLELLTMDDLGDELAPEMRLVQRDDPEAYQFASTKYSAHKMPKDVVDASMTPGGMKDMLEEWRRAQEKEDEEGQGTNAT